MPTSRSTDPGVTFGDTTLDTSCGEAHTARVAAGTSSASPAPETYEADGRTPRALTEERISGILEQVRIGVPPQTAAVAAGVPRRTWQNWLARGREDDAPEPYASVAVRLEEATAVYHRSRVSVIHAGAEKDPRLAQWELERRFSDEWGDKNRAGVTINLGVILQSQEWIDLRDRVLAALDPFPDAQDAVIAVLGGQVIDGEASEVAELAA